MNEYNTPILLIIFNRLETTKVVFERIRKIQPHLLYIAADGPRDNKPFEKETCNEVRNFVISSIDWECEVKTLFQNKNLGCGSAVSSAITWFFSKVEKGIILEDDCLPDLSFFSYAEALLNYYESTDRVMHISGNNPLGCFFPPEGSYFFSHIQHCWGWATWARAWRKFQYKLNKDQINNVIEHNAYFTNKLIARFWKDLFLQTVEEKTDVWDFQWTFTILENNGLCVTPAKNLISNIGLNSGTHFQGLQGEASPVYSMMNEIVHPLNNQFNHKFDHQVAYKFFHVKKYFYRNLLRKLLLKIRLLELFKKLRRGIIVRHV